MLYFCTSCSCERRVTIKKIVNKHVENYSTVWNFFSSFILKIKMFSWCHLFTSVSSAVKVISWHLFMDKLRNNTRRKWDAIDKCFPEILFLMNQDRDFDLIKSSDIVTSVEVIFHSLRKITNFSETRKQSTKNIRKEKNRFSSKIFSIRWKVITKEFSQLYLPIFQSWVVPCPSSPHIHQGSG